jgi:hypothetical protein
MGVTPVIGVPLTPKFTPAYPRMSINRKRRQKTKRPRSQREKAFFLYVLGLLDIR